MFQDPPAVRPAELIEASPVTLRRWRPDDLAALHQAVTESRDHLIPWMPWAADSTTDAQAEFLRDCERDWQAGAAYNYAILDRGTLAGSCGLMARIGPGGLEIGYWIHQAHLRRGLATEASRALIDEAFALPGIDHIEIVHDELNESSGGIPRKLGFTRIGCRQLDPKPRAGTGTGVVWRLTRPEP
jgi:ribosomal-protein-serine acetyltransferase